MSSISSADSPCLVASYDVRPNEHLAVLLPKDHWKPDDAAKVCDTFNCTRRFSWFERRHHCRKCGGVFCQPCSSRTTILLDTSSLDWLYPPPNTPVTSFATEISPVIEARVCDTCYNDIHGRPAMTRPTPPALDVSSLRAGSSAVDVPSAASSLCSSVAISTPPDGAPIRSSTSPLSRRASLRKHTSPLLPAAGLPSPIPELDAPYGELDAYPLKLASALCKASGGGRWTPAPVQAELTQKVCPLAALRQGARGWKAPFEVEIEREEAEERRRASNPVIVDGEFQYRFPREQQRRPARCDSLSTF